MKKLLIGLLLSFIAPFLLLVPIIGAAASVEGFYDPDSGEDFNIETFKTSSTVLTVKSWYDEYINDYADKMNDRKREVEKEHTTIEIIQKPGSEQESDTQEDDKPEPETGVKEQADTGKNVSVHKMENSKFEEIAVEQPQEPAIKPQPDETSKDEKNEGEDEEKDASEDNQEQQTEEREVCHVNVIISMDEYPLSSILAYYNALYIQAVGAGERFELPAKGDVHDMLAAMTEYSETQDDDSENYYINMHFKFYDELPYIVFSGMPQDEYDEYSEMYLNLTEMISGWIDEDLSTYKKESEDGRK